MSASKLVVLLDEVFHFTILSVLFDLLMDHLTVNESHLLLHALYEALFKAIHTSSAENTRFFIHCNFGSGLHNLLSFLVSHLLLYKRI